MPGCTGAIVADCLALLRPEIAARGTEVIIGPMPAVNADAGLLASVFQNLIWNALRHGPTEGGVVGISAPRGAGSWRVAVDSEGTPIGPERASLFAPFSRAENEHRVEGAGLGLAICREIVEEHGGTIGVEPRERGNRFFFTLPD